MTFKVKWLVQKSCWYTDLWHVWSHYAIFSLWASHYRLKRRSTLQGASLIWSTWPEINDLLKVKISMGQLQTITFVYFATWDLTMWTWLSLCRVYARHLVNVVCHSAAFAICLHTQICTWTIMVFFSRVTLAWEKTKIPLMVPRKVLYLTHCNPREPI